MKTQHLAAALAALLASILTAAAQGTTAFTYQGRLNLNGSPANAAFDLRFELFETPAGGASRIDPSEASNVAVSNGLFVAQVDFGPLADKAYWMEIGLRPAGSGSSFTILNPRQRLTPTPYANFAMRAGSYQGPIGDYQLSPNVLVAGPGATIGPLNFVAPTRPVAFPPFSVNTSLLVSNLNADELDGFNASDFWKLGGNADTVPGPHYVGTSDNQPLELRANLQLGLRLEPNPNTNVANLLAPGTLSFGFRTRQMLDLWGADYGIGVQNHTMYFRTRPGSWFDPGDPGGNFTWFTGGQHSDTAFDPGPVFFQRAAELMRLEGDGQLTVFGTTRNGVHGRSSSANGVQGNSATASASGVYGENTGGGIGVAGRTTGTGSAIYGDNTSASGWAGNFNGRVHVGGDQHFGSQTRQMLNLWGTQYGIGVQASTLYFRTDTGNINHGFAWYKGGAHNDGTLNSGGGVQLMRLNELGLFVLGSLVQTSDRASKENIRPVDPRAVLDKVASMPLSEWSYKRDPSSRHVGPMAQDFRAAFGLGHDDKGIATVDADGVALAAIQGLNEKVEVRSERAEGRIQKLESENAELKQRLTDLERLLTSLSAKETRP